MSLVVANSKCSAHLSSLDSFTFTLKQPLQQLIQCPEVSLAAFECTIVFVCFLKSERAGATLKIMATPFPGHNCCPRTDGKKRKDMRLNIMK